MHPAKLGSAKPAIDHLTEDSHCAACRDALASAAHEFKTPLAIMGGYLHLLLTQKLGPLTPQQLDVLSEMQDNGVRLTNFVQNVLTYATLKVDRYEIQYEVADINACLREIAEFWAQRFQDKAIAFYFFPDDKLPAFPFDWYKVQHVVSNLLDNAMKYTPSARARCGCTLSRTSGSAALSSASRWWNGADAWWPTRTAAASRWLTPVPASHPSFSRRFLKSIFACTSAGTRAEGHGLGLAIARRLVQAAGGKIWVESEPGSGSKFSFLCLLNPPSKESRTTEEQ